MVKIRLYFVLSQLLPTGMRGNLERLIIQSGFETIDPRKYAGFMVLFTLVAALLAGVVANQFYPKSFWIPFGAVVGTLLAVAGGFYIILFFAAENRASAVEENLPEALRIIAANIRAGMTVENAVWSVSKPEFGVLGDEIRHMSVAVYAGKPISDALKELGARVDSKLLRRSASLLAEGIELGGEIANLLDEVADSIKQTKDLRKEIRNATISYTLFIVFSAVIVAPMLFSVSVYYSETNEKMLARQQSVDYGNMQRGPSSLGGGGSPLGGFAFRKIASQITSNDVRLFAMSAIFITSFFSALTIGLLQHGKAQWGVKLIPVFVPLSLGIFFLVHFLLTSAFTPILQ